MTTYTVRAGREGAAWTATVPELAGVQTWGRGLRHLEESVREAIALAQDLPDDAKFDMCWVFETGDSDINRQASELRDRRQEVTQASQELATETAALVRRLHELGFSVRDAATIAGISRARAGQLIAID